MQAVMLFEPAYLIRVTILNALAYDGQYLETDFQFSLFLKTLGLSEVLKKNQ